MIDILVLNYNDAQTTICFVNSVKNYSCVRKILVVDNHSTDNSLNEIKKIQSDKIVVVDSGINAGYGAGNNFGIRYLKERFDSEYILLSNPDVIVKENVIVELENFLRNNRDYAISAPFMLNSKEEKQYNTAFRIPSKWEYILSINSLITKLTNSFYYKNITAELKNVKDVGAVAGSMFLMRTKDMINYGMFDENVFLYCEELILGIKLQNANRKIALLTNNSFIHNHSVSINKTYKSSKGKKSLLMKSKLYVIRHYYKANIIEYFIAIILAKLSIAEDHLIDILSGHN